MITSTKPTILLIPGSFSRSFMYDDMAATIRSLGYTFEIADLPSSSRKPPSPAATMAEDAQLYNTMLAKLCHDEGKDVVVVGHSYGGMVLTEAIKGFTEPQDGKGRVVGLVYLTALVPKVGDSLHSLMADEPTDISFLRIEGDYMYHEPEGSAKVNFSDLPYEKGIEWAKQFSWHSLPSLSGECTYGGYDDVKNVAYIFCTQDKTLPPAFQRKQIANMNSGRGGKGQVTVYEFESGHCPPASRPEDLGKDIVKAIEAFA